MQVMLRDTIKDQFTGQKDDRFADVNEGITLNIFTKRIIGTGEALLHVMGYP